eukprot:CAMPEP_0119317838 /NCGR_PEP_ID=MMETSP1333-20130426/44508_1 /TAXON_ID=418940 /ORGANISM="Scyphosphaera apsteinii, Strain RCC1455" /LENGTH=49 /DNA_ID=CAMNT_0007323897 /DNA_START=204 /DNA_END=353 /DNA_ORIENTATION=-
MEKLHIALRNGYGHGGGAQLDPVLARFYGVWYDAEAGRMEVELTVGIAR